jgi:ATP-binding cassette subfamily B protein
MKSFPFYKQLNAMDCGPTCLRMIAMHFGKHYNSETLRQIAGYSKQGVSLLGISETAEKIGFRTRGVILTFKQIKEAPLPCILHWNQNHFVVLTDISWNNCKIYDPEKGITNYTINEFLHNWESSKNEDGENVGTALLLEPTPAFYEAEGDQEKKLSWRLILQYLNQSRVQISYVFFALIIESILQLILPFLTQSIVDKGVNTQNIQFVTIILLAQVMLTISQTIVNFIRTRLLLRISNILNLQIHSDFWIKLTKLPVSYFDAHHTGDILQRIGDHNKIQSFLAGTALNTLFSIFNFLTYAIILMIYNSELFFVFIIGSFIYFGWVHFFLRIQRKLNHEEFHLASKEKNATLQLIQGMQEIRLNNAEKQKRWDWENIQASHYKLNLKGLNYSQWQTAGAVFINQVQNITISFIVAKLVIDGKLTLGAMLAVQYIIGQLSGPISQWVEFVHSAQSAKISMERLNEIHQLPDEESIDKIHNFQLSDNKSIQLHNVSFTYPGVGNDPVLKNINLYIPNNKVTAIVGASGSGKTTLLKILLKVYDKYEGDIYIANSELSKPGASEIYKDGIQFDQISHSYWRGKCGAVMQEGFIFNDTIARNIAVGQENIDYEKLVQSCIISNILSFIKKQPNGFYAKLGAEGTGLSQGQKQRILIARAVYKNPPYLFFDEATNSLDANNEKEIVESLNTFLKGKTAVVVAHRLSTVKSADKIVVLHDGQITEEGTHDYLISLRGNYYQLIKNQLELGI